MYMYRELMCRHPCSGSVKLEFESCRIMVDCLMILIIQLADAIHELVAASCSSFNMKYTIASFFKLAIEYSMFSLY